MGCGSSTNNAVASDANSPEVDKKPAITPNTPDGPRKLHVVHFNDVYNLEPTSKDPEAMGGCGR